MNTDEQGSGNSANDNAQLTSAIAGLLSRHDNQPMAAINTLLNENFSLREKNRQIRAELAELQQSMPEGAVIFTADAAKELEEYRRHGKPADVGGLITERDALKQQVAKMSRSQEIAKVAAATGWKPSVLEQLSGDLKFEIKEVEADGVKTQAAYVVPENGAPQRLADYAKTAWADFLPALMPQQAASDNGDVGVPFIEQKQGQGPKPKDMVDQFLNQQAEARKAAPNPLMAGVTIVTPGQAAEAKR